MQIPLQDLHPNPYRDFELHPLDQAQVERLKASLDADGFWASVVARKVADGYQIAYGHHRIEAARALGLPSVPIEVRDLSDWQMVRMLASENAMQRGSTAAACLDAVAAIARVLAYNLLRWDEATLVRNLTTVGFDYATCRGLLDRGEGIGRSCVQSFAPKDAFSRSQIDAALGTLKDSGRMAGIITDASTKAEAELRVEQEEAERALAEAEARQAEARDAAEKVAAAKQTKQAKQTATKRRKATEATGKAMAAVQRKPIIYDARCNQLFRLDSHAAEFRRIVTGETFQSYLPLDRQFEFGKSVLASIRENNPKKKEITAADIRTECWARIESGLGMFRQDMRTAPERPYQKEMAEGLNLFRRAFSDGRRGVALIASAIRKGETLTAKQRQQLDSYLDGVTVWLEIRELLPKNNLKLVEG